MGMRWEEEIDNRYLLYKSENEKIKRMVIDFADDMDDDECDFEVTTHGIDFHAKKKFN